MHDIINRLRNKKDDEGFTLIELLVVVVIIGVLVAIAVPVYLNYRKGAADKSAQSDVRGAVSTIEQYYTDNGNSYPTSITLTEQAASFSLNSPATLAGTAGWVSLSEKTVMTYIPTLTGTPATAATYKVCAENSNGSSKLYVYDSAVGGSVKTINNGDIKTCA